MFASLRSWFAAMRRRDRFETGMDEEMRFHLQEQIEDLIRAGVPPAEAHRRARLAFGAVDAAKADCRRARGLQFFDEVRQDLAYAVRSLSRTPGFAAGAIISIALGLGANVAIFTVLKATLQHSLMFREPDRLVVIWSTPPQHPEVNQTVSIPEYAYLARQSDTFEAVGAKLLWTANVGAVESGEPADRLTGQRFTTSLFEVLGVPPERGRVFNSAESFVDAPATSVVISHNLWQGRFGGDPDILNKTAIIDGSSLAIVGVMPPGFELFDDAPEYWIQMNFSRFQLQSAARPGVLTVVGRLKTGVSIHEAQRRMDAAAAQLEHMYPEANRGRGFRVKSLETEYFNDLRRPLLILQAAVVVVLLIACANVAGLLLIRGSTQQRELAIRTAVGAGRFRIVRQLLTESLCLASVGAAIGLVLAWSTLRVLAMNRPIWLARIDTIAIDGPVLAFTALLAIATGVAFGTAPALYNSRQDAVGRFNGGARGATGDRHRRLMQRALVTAQLALTLVLLIGAGLVVKTFMRLQSANLGFDPNRVFLFETRLPANQYFRQVGMTNGFTQLEMSPVPAALFNRVFQRLQQLPGVESAAGINVSPLAGAIQLAFTVEGRPTDAAGQSDKNALNASYYLVTPKYFATMKVPIVQGRDFSERDTANSPWVAIINQAMARRYWPTSNPIGQRLVLDIVPEEQPREVIAVVGDMPVTRLDQDPTPIVYASQLQQPSKYRVPFGQSRVQMTYVMRLTEQQGNVLPLVRGAVAEVDPRLPVAEPQTMDRYLGRQIETPRYYMVLLGAFAAIALMLATLGVYGVVAYAVAQRAREIAIRLALGAPTGGILVLVSRDTVMLILIGVPLGLLGALALTRFLGAVLWGVSATDPATYAAVAAFLPVVALLATLVPACRVLRLDPRAVLATE
jgi:predicted permease